MNRQHRSELQAVIKVLIKCRIQSAQLFERQIRKLAMFLQAQLHGFTDLFVGQAEGTPRLTR